MENISIKAQNKPKSNCEKPNAKITRTNHCLSIVSLNANGLNSSTKRHRLVDQIKKRWNHVYVTYQDIQNKVKCGKNENMEKRYPRLKGGGELVQPL